MKTPEDIAEAETSVDPAASGAGGEAAAEDTHSLSK